jgi:hypothetical protein
MKTSALFIILPLVMSLFLTACELPDIEGLNSMSKITGSMNDKLGDTKEKLHQQTLLLALTELNKRENQENIYPVATGLMPAGKAFAEEATVHELIELTNLEIKKLEENTMVTGFGKQGPLPLNEQEQNYSNLRKYATLSSLQVIAGFAQEEKVDEIIQCVIDGSDENVEACTAFLALRTFFLREVLLKLSLKIDASSAKTLNSSGKMNAAIKYLKKLEKITNLAMTYPSIRLAIKGEAEFIGFDEDVKAHSSETFELWNLALEKAYAGMKVYEQSGPSRAAELAAQQQAIQEMQQRIAQAKP